MCFIQCCLLQEVLTEHVCAIGVQWGFNVVGGMTDAKDPYPWLEKFDDLKKISLQIEKCLDLATNDGPITVLLD